MQDYRKLSLVLFLIGTDCSLDPSCCPGEYLLDLNLDRFDLFFALFWGCDVSPQLDLSDLQNVIARLKQ